ncbi:MAG TPA: cytochrome C oxidase subunit IV family protein [Thermoanaerobaculia bacterium]|nr:cytochrome C oxidase subunit IV family protein [Thermoanaerobaculia bacterium]
MSTHTAPSHAPDHGPSHTAQPHGAHDIRAHVKVYMMVFGALAVLTVVTVAASYLDIPLGPAIALALLIATVKASLVALFFMHLKGEVRSVMWTLLLTAVFFLALMTIPLSWYLDGPKHPEGTGPTARSLTTLEAR